MIWYSGLQGDIYWIQQPVSTSDVFTWSYCEPPPNFLVRKQRYQTQGAAPTFVTLKLGG